MKKLLSFFSLSILVLFFTCCSNSKVVIPTDKNLPSIEDNFAILWVGKGEAYAHIEGQYQRSPSNDYSFEVIQRRYGNSWRSIKNMHRIHPDYDGKAGPREQTLFFTIDFAQKNGALKSTINSSIGAGSGYSDVEFREQGFQLESENVSSFSPYNTFRITQHYKYEEGVLHETVELFKLKKGQEFPFAKIEEEAIIFRPKKLQGAPTRFQ